MHNIKVNCLQYLLIFLNFVNEFKLQLHTYVFNYCNMGSHGLIPEDKTTLQRCPIPISGIACKNKNLTLKLHFWN